MSDPKLSDHHAADRGRRAYTPQETRDRINSDHPCCVPVGDAVVVLAALAEAQGKLKARDVVPAELAVVALRHERDEARTEVARLKEKHESGGAVLYAGLCHSIIRRILEGPDRWVDEPHDTLLRLESYIRRAESLEQAEAALAAERSKSERLREYLDDALAVLAAPASSSNEMKRELARKMRAALASAQPEVQP